MDKKWRILIDRSCQVLRISMLDARLTSEDCSQFQSDLTFACLRLKQQGKDLEDFVKGDEVNPIFNLAHGMVTDRKE